LAATLATRLRLTPRSKLDKPTPTDGNYRSSDPAISVTPITFPARD
jgi:hypothetical protein